MKKIYEQPEMELETFTVEDVITDSTDETPDVPHN